MAKKKNKTEDIDSSGWNWPKRIDDIIKNHPANTDIFPRMELANNFVRGDQYKDICQETMDVVDVKLTRETRSVYNLMAPFEKMATSKMLQGELRPFSKPYEGNTERFDRDVAIVSNSVMWTWWDQEKMPAKMYKLVKSGNVNGLGAGKLFFDKTAGKKLKFDQEKISKMGFDKDTDELKTGAIYLETVSPNKEFFPDVVANDDSEMRYVVYRYAQAQTVVEDRFGLPRGSLKSDDKTEQEQNRITTTIAGRTYKLDEGVEKSDIVYVKELFWHKDKEFPEGKHVIVVNQKTVVDESLTKYNRLGKLPSYTFPINPVEGEFYGLGYVFPTRHFQRDINKCHSLTMENIEWTAMNKWYCNDSICTLAEGEMDNTAFEIIHGDGPNGIEALSGQGIPQHLWENPNKVMRMMQVYWGLPDVDMGAVPYRGTGISGKGIQQLQAASDLSHSEDKLAIENWVKRVMKDFLKLVQIHFTAEEIAAWIGENKMSKILKFMDSNLDFDIGIKLAEGYGTRPEIKLDQMVKFSQAVPGTFEPQHIRKAMANFANIDFVVEETFRAEAQAERHLDKLINDKPMYDETGLISKYINYDVHIKFFKEFVETEDFELLPFETQKAIDSHIQMLFEQKQAMMMPMGQPGVAPGQVAPVTNPTGGGNRTALEGMQAEQNLHLATGQPTNNVPQF